MDGALLSIYAATDATNMPKVIDAIKEEVEYTLYTPPTNEELQRAKNKIRSRVYGEMDTSDGVALKAVYEEFYGHDSTSKFLANVDKVTSEDVLEFAAKVFTANKYTVIGKGK
jgi:predicted Zn-dependent peptidase